MIVVLLVFALVLLIGSGLWAAHDSTRQVQEYSRSNARVLKEFQKMAVHRPEYIINEREEND